MQDNFTRVPNSIIDNAKLNPYQFQLFSIIVRKTDGWCKVEDGISLSQFEKLVTFKKCKIVSTLKELENLGYIEKKKQYNEDKKTYSYSLYRVSKKVVLENNKVVSEKDKGSISEIQGVVSEEYKQKKLTTKETNTKKPSLLDEYKKQDTLTEQGEQTLQNFIDYRKQIKKPIKTTAPLKAYITTLRELVKKGYDYKEVIDLQKEREWQTVKSEWVEKSLKPKGKSDVFASSRNVGGYTA